MRRQLARRLRGTLVGGVMGMVVALGTLGALGCGRTITHPPSSPHLPEEFAEVPFPPPAIRSDMITGEQRPGAIWIDGEWSWNGTRWVWRRGGYVVPPQGATLARWELQREGTTLREAPSMFHLPDGTSVALSELREKRGNRARDVECIPPVATASSSAGSIAMGASIPMSAPCAQVEP